MMESWVLGYKEKLRCVKTRWDKYRFYKSIYDRVLFPFRFIFDPRHCLLKSTTRGIKLEDIKRNPYNIIPIIADWIGINNHNSLYKSEFLNKKFSRPSDCFNNITGFDTRSIDVYKGRFFGKKDILILETLLWPFLRSYGYSTILESEFSENLRKIKPMLFEPFEFEISISEYLGLEISQIKETDQFKRFRRFIIPVYESLNNSNKYPEIIKPLI